MAQAQYLQYTAQPVNSYPGVTVYTYPGAQQQPQTMVVQPGAASATVSQNRYDAKGSRATVVLAAIQFTIGCSCICFQSIATHLETSLGRVNSAEFLGAGIWCGILFLVTGALGLGAGKRNLPGLIIAFMVMNIISTLAIWTLLSFAAANLAYVRQCQQEGIIDFSSIFSIRLTCKSELYSVWIAMDAFMLTLALVELIIAVTSAAFCCRAVCYCCRSNPGMVLQQPGSGVYVATTTQLPYQPQQQQYQHQAAGGKPYPTQEPYAQYPAGGAATSVSVSYGQASYGQPGQPQYQQQQPTPAMTAYPQPGYGPYATASLTAMPAASGAPTGAAYAGPAYYPTAAGDSKGMAVASAPELPPSYDTAQKL